jgi:hypothetical protein
VASASFQRHKKHVSQELKRSRESQQAGDKTASGPLAGSPGPVRSPVGSIVPAPPTEPVNVSEQIAKFLPVLRAIVGQAMQSRQYFAAAAGSREYREFLRLVAQMDGSLPLGGTRVAVSDGRQTMTVEFLDSLIADANSGEDDYD